MLGGMTKKVVLIDSMLRDGIATAREPMSWVPCSIHRRLRSSLVLMMKIAKPPRWLMAVLENLLKILEREALP